MTSQRRGLSEHIILILHHHRRCSRSASTACCSGSSAACFRTARSRSDGDAARDGPPPAAERRRVHAASPSASASHTVIRDVTFSVPDLPGTGEFIAILGPSGCGKSTVLRLIAGLRPHHPATRGHGAGRRQAGRGPGADRGMVFQDYTSFDNRTVEDNVAFGLECRGVPAQRAPRAGARVDRARSASTSTRDARKYPQRAVGRHAPARRDRAHADPVAAHHPDGRAVRRARSDDAAEHAGAAGRPVARGAGDGLLRHPLDRGGGLPRRSRLHLLVGARARSCARWRCRRRTGRRKEMQREPAFLEHGVRDPRHHRARSSASTRAGRRD